MRHETDVSSPAAKKAFFVRFWTSFFAYALRIARSNVGNVRRSRIVGRDGMMRQNRFGVYRWFCWGHGNHADRLSPDQRHTLLSKIRPVLPQLWPQPHMI